MESIPGSEKTPGTLAVRNAPASSNCTSIELLALAREALHVGKPAQRAHYARKVLAARDFQHEVHRGEDRAVFLHADRVDVRARFGDLGRDVREHPALVRDRDL